MKSEGYTFPTDPKYFPAGIVHHHEWLLPAPDGGVDHCFFDKSIGERVIEHYTAEQWSDYLDGMEIEAGER